MDYGGGWNCCGGCSVEDANRAAEKQRRKFSELENYLPSKKGELLLPELVDLSVEMVSSLLENVKRLTLYQISEILDNKKPLTSDEIEKLKIKSQLKEIKLAQLILATQAEIRRIMKIINN